MPTKQLNQQSGWTCPRCGNSYAPWVMKCPTCAMSAEPAPFPNPWRPKRPSPWPYEPWDEKPYNDEPYIWIGHKEPWDEPIVKILY